MVNGYTCDCTGTGYRGENCEEDINECALESPCINGRCNNTMGDYHCLCPETYCGKQCGRQDPCQLQSGLCKNEGVCVSACDDTKQGYICQCAPGWEGPSCLLKVNIDIHFTIS